MQKIIFFDTETTGVDSTDFLCQLAYKIYSPGRANDETFCELYKPEIKIPAEASAVHHITNKMVENKIPFQKSPDFKKIKNLFENADSILVAHNAKFDVAIIKKENINPKNVICTLRVARALDKENKLPQHKLQFLRYFLDIEIDAKAHNALGDVLVLEKLFERLFDKIKKENNFSDEEVLQNMIKISARPSLMYSFSFGKHNGKTVEDVAKMDRGYLEWFLATKEEENPEDEDWIYTLKHYLGK
ncbi:MAG: exonuclease domain-containing protein [Patescibacteria group bacterium]